MQHHERLDGSGYPYGLKDGEILPEAKILSVADVVEAMTSHRPYRAALGIDAALDEITRHRNVLYDAAVVDACIRLFCEKGYAFPSGGSGVSFNAEYWKEWSVPARPYDAPLES